LTYPDFFGHQIISPYRFVAVRTLLFLPDKGKKRQDFTFRPPIQLKVLRIRDRLQLKASFLLESFCQELDKSQRLRLISRQKKTEIFHAAGKI
jgi:hypothetical protein